MINRKFFFDQARLSLFGGTLKSAQVNGIEFILNQWEPTHAHWDDRWLAYALGTTHHETDMHMQPIREYGSTKYLENNYGPAGRNPARARRMGNTQPGDGVRYCGRGFVQLTWKNNYAAMSRHLSQVFGQDIDLVAHPDLAMQPEYAAEIMFHGMHVGAFTGKKFSDFFSKTADGRIGKDDWVNARRTINGTDRASVIASIARRYYSAISYL